MGFWCTSWPIQALNQRPVLRHVPILCPLAACVWPRLHWIMSGRQHSKALNRQCIVSLSRLQEFSFQKDFTCLMLGSAVEQILMNSLEVRCRHNPISSLILLHSHGFQVQPGTERKGLPGKPVHDLHLFFNNPRQLEPFSIFSWRQLVIDVWWNAA